MERDLQLATMEAIKFYGSIASTNGISEEAKETANKNIIRLLGGLQSNTEQLLASLSGIQL